MLSQAYQYGRSVLTDWQRYSVLKWMLLLFEVVFTSVIILKIPYTEIDWVAYMQEVNGWVEGDTDYLNLKGDTGPLVYPAGFMYIFRFFRSITNNGADIRSAQWIFFLVYLLTQYLVLSLFGSIKVGSPYLAILFVLSKRLHSLFVLRLFNDCIAMLFFYMSLHLFVKRKWDFGAIIYSVALSVKMNLLLFLPGLLFLLVRNRGLFRAAFSTILIVVVQILAGGPFLLNYPESYLSRAFEFSRVFKYQWTVNWKMLNEEFFVSKNFALFLLFCHLSILVFVALPQWCAADGGVLSVFLRVLGNFLSSFRSAKRKVEPPTPRLRRKSTASITEVNWNTHTYKDSPPFIVFVLLSSNFIGMVFSRSMHYQFLTWYFHSLPFLAAFAGMPISWVLPAFGAIEYAFNVGDVSGAGSGLSSMILLWGHLVFLIHLLVSKAPSNASKKLA